MTEAPRCTWCDKLLGHFHPGFCSTECETNWTEFQKDPEGSNERMLEAQRRNDEKR